MSLLFVCIAPFAPQQQRKAEKAVTGIKPLRRRVENGSGGTESNSSKVCPLCVDNSLSIFSFSGQFSTNDYVFLVDNF